MGFWRDVVIGRGRQPSEIFANAVKLRNNYKIRRVLGFTDVGQNEALEASGTQLMGSMAGTVGPLIHQIFTPEAAFSPTMIAVSTAAHTLPIAHNALNAYARRLPRDWVTPGQYWYRQRTTFGKDVQRNLMNNPMFKVSHYNVRRVLGF